MDQNLSDAFSRANIKRVSVNLPKSKFTNVKTSSELILYLLLDVSGSMNEGFSDKRLSSTGMSKLQAAYEGLKEILSKHMAGWELGVLMFGVANGTTEWLLLPGQDIKNMRMPHAQGNTPLLPALKEVWASAGINVKENKRIIVLTDGCPNFGGGKIECLENARMHQDIPIDCIGIKGGEYDPNFLRELAKATGGIFAEISSMQMLWNVLLEFSPEIRLLGSGRKELPRVIKL